jgi:phospholipid-binding lipoprotein MlaA
MKKKLIVSLLSLMLASSVNAATDGNISLSKESKKPKVIKDCFEGLNRATFSLNEGLDKVIFRPAAKGYRKLPSPVRTGTSNALENLSSLITIPNNILQGQFKTAGINTGRFIINSTIGVLGLIDVAEKMDFPEYEKEDYGQTLGVWGVGAGCYVVLPVLGPSTVRDTFGSFVNVMGGDPYYNASTHGNNEYLSKSLYGTTKIISGVDFRAKNLETLDNLKKNSLDFYASVKSLYLQDRQQKISNSNPTIEIMYEGDWEEIETQ